MPPKNTAVGSLARALTRLEKNQCKTNLNKVVRDMLMKLGPHMSFTNRLIIANLWLFKPLFIGVFSKSNSGNALLRTTTAATMLEGSIAPNVLPQRASAVINFRLAPGEIGKDLLNHMEKVIDDKNIRIEPIRIEDPSLISSINCLGYKKIEAAVHSIFKESVITPYLVLGGTDARKYENVCNSIFRFSPYQIKSEELNSMHGTNERISLKNIENCIKFYIGIIK